MKCIGGEKLNQLEIANKCNISNRTVYDWLKKFNIKTRSIEESTQLYFSKYKSKYKNRNWLYKKYCTEKLSSNDMSKISGASYSSICRWLKNIIFLYENIVKLYILQKEIIVNYLKKLWNLSTENC